MTDIVKSCFWFLGCYWSYYHLRGSKYIKT